MKTIRFAWLAAGLLGLPGLGLAQRATPTLPQPTASSLPLQAILVAPPASSHAVLGGPPQLAAEPADPTASLDELLRQLEQAASQPTDAATLARLGLRVSQQLAQQLAATRQQLADLRRQLTTTQRVAGDLLTDHAEVTALRQQLNLLQQQQAALTGRQYRGIAWSAD